MQLSPAQRRANKIARRARNLHGNKHGESKAKRLNRRMRRAIKAAAITDHLDS